MRWTWTTRIGPRCAPCSRLAGQAVAGEGDEVSGFSIVYQMPGGNGGITGFEYGGMADGSCFQSFQWGVGRAGGNGGVQPIDY